MNEVLTKAEQQVLDSLLPEKQRPTRGYDSKTWSKRNSKKNSLG